MVAFSMAVLALVVVTLVRHQSQLDALYLERNTLQCEAMADSFLTSRVCR